MATAEKTTIKVEKTIQADEDAYILTLSKDEAETLRAVVGMHVNGAGRRKHTDAIWHALNAAGINPGRISGIKGMITMENGPDPAKPKIGDRVRITRADDYPDWVGWVGILVDLDTDDEPYFVDSIGWVNDVETVNDSPIKVGDRVKILEAYCAEQYVGEMGVVTSVTDTWHCAAGPHPYRVHRDGGTGELHVKRVERVS